MLRQKGSGDMMRKQALVFAATAAMGIGTLGGPVRAEDQTGSSSIGQSSSGSSSAQGLGASANASAQAGSDQWSQVVRSANDADKLFLVNAAIDNECEIQLGRIAQQKSQDPQVKQIAERMVRDHEKASQQLRQTAQQANLQIPQSSSLPELKQQELTVFRSLDGKDFDKQYISHLRAGHAKDVSKYQDVSQMAKNDQVKQFASQTLPTLQQHQQHVEQAAMALGMPSGMEAQPAGARIGSQGIDAAKSPDNRSNPRPGSPDDTSGTSGSSGSSSGTSGSSGSSGTSGGIGGSQPGGSNR